MKKAGQGTRRETGCGRFQLICATFAVMAMTTGTHAFADNAIDRVLSRATQARDKAKAAKESADEIRSRIREAAENLSGNVKAAIIEKVREMSGKISVTMEGQREFQLQGCEQFRAELVAFLVNVQTLDERIIELTSPCSGLSGHDRGTLDPLISLVQQAPCGVLYPLYQVEIDFCPLGQLTETVDALQIIQDIVGGINAPQAPVMPVVSYSNADEDQAADLDAQVFAARLSASRIYMENHAVLAEACRRINNSYYVLSKIGSHLQAKGETEMKATVGMHGYALLEVSSNQKKEIGKELESMAKILKSISGFVEGKLKTAKDLSAMNLQLSMQAQIIRNQERIMQAQGLINP